MSHPTLDDWIARDGLILDLRCANDYRAAHAVGSSHIPLQQLEERLHELPTKAVPLWLVGDDELRAGHSLLSERGYQISGCSRSDAVTQIERGDTSRQMWGANFFLQEVVQNFGAQLGSTALDIGCGSGRDAVYLAMQGKDVRAVDIKPQALAKARTLAAYNGVALDTQLCDIEKEPFSPEATEILIVMRYLHRPLLPQLGDWVCPGGHLIYQTFLEGAQAFGSPKRKASLLEKGELARHFSDWDILIDRIDTLADGRPVNSFLACKPEAYP